MTDESALAVPAGPETVVETPEVKPQGAPQGQAESQTAAETPEGGEAEKSEAAKRRDRDKAYKERLRQEADAANAKAEQAEQRRLKIIQAGESEKPPVEGDFTDYAEYVAAKAVWATRKQDSQIKAQDFAEEAEAARQQAKAIEEREQQIVTAQWVDRVAEAKTRYADFEAVALAPDVPITPQIADMLKQSDRGPDLAYWLGTNKAAAAELARLSPVEAAWHLGRIEASLNAPTPRTTPQTPDPIVPVRGNTSTTLDPSKMPIEEYISARKAGKI